MFETLVMTKRERTAARTALAFPAAAVLQVGLAGTMLVYSLLHIPAVKAPSLAWSFFQGDIHVVVPIQKATPATRNEPARSEPRNDGYAPDAVPDGTPPPDGAGPRGPVDGDPNGVDGGMPPPDDYRPPDEVPVARPVHEIRDPWQVRAPQPISRVAPDYPPAARAIGMEGRVVVQLVVNEEGRVVDARVQHVTNPIFEEPALRAVRLWTFTRPIDAQSNQAVSCYLTVVVNFTLRG